MTVRQITEDHVAVVEVLRTEPEAHAEVEADVEAGGEADGESATPGGPSACPPTTRGAR
jgi:hypothetical protein